MRYQPSRVLHVSNVLQPGFTQGSMLTPMFNFCHAPPSLMSRAMIASAPLFLSACAVMQEAEPTPAPAPAPSTSLPQAASPAPSSATASVTPTPAASSQTLPAGTLNTSLDGAASGRSAALALPAAIAARFPAPPARYNTPGLQEGRLAWSTADEIGVWLSELTLPNPAPTAPTAPKASAASAASAANRRRSPTIQATLLSLSPPASYSSSVTSAMPPGPRMQAVHLSTPVRKPPATPQANEANVNVEPPARPTVLLVGGRETSAATEALLVVARELTRGKLRPLLTRIDVVVVPHSGLAALADPAVPDDHVQLNTASAQILAKLAQAQQATVLVWAGEAPAMTTVGSQAVLRAVDITVDHASNPNLPEFLTRASEQWFRQPMLAALQAEALRADKGPLTGPSMPGEIQNHENIANAAALKNRIGLQLLTAGSDLGRAHVQRRVHAHVTAISSALSSTARRAAELAELRPYLDREVTAQACRHPFVMDPASQSANHPPQLLDLNTGAEISVPARAEAAMPARTAPEQMRIKPCGYWLAAEASEAVERLRLHGVQVMRVAEPASLLGDTYQSTKHPPPIDQVNAAKRFNLVRGVIDAPAHSFYVPVDQAQGNLVVSALEPDAPSSLAITSLLDATAGMARIMTPPAVRLEALP